MRSVWLGRSEATLSSNERLKIDHFGPCRDTAADEIECVDSHNYALAKSASNAIPKITISDALAAVRAPFPIQSRRGENEERIRDHFLRFAHSNFVKLNRFVFIDLFSHSLFVVVFSSVAIFRSSSPEQREQSENIVEAHAFLLRSNNNDDGRKQIRNKKRKKKNSKMERNRREEAEVVNKNASADA